MKIIKKLLLALVVLIVLFVAVGFFMPNDYKVTRSVEIKASAADIHALVGDVKRWEDWTAWNKERFPKMTVNYNEVTTGVGANYSWSDPDNGNGKLTLLESDPAKGIKFKLEYEGFDEAFGTVSYSESGGKTTVDWVFEGKVTMPVIGGYFSMLMESMMSPDLEKGLAKLKTVAEKAKAIPAA